MPTGRLTDHGSKGTEESRGLQNGKGEEGLGFGRVTWVSYKAFGLHGVFSFVRALKDFEVVLKDFAGFRYAYMGVSWAFVGLCRAL